VEFSSRSPGGHHTPPGTKRMQNHHCTITAWQTPPCRQAPRYLPPPGTPVTRRQAPVSLQAFCFTISSGGTFPAARRPARKYPLSLVCDPSAWRFAHAARRHTNSTMLFVFGT